MKLPITTGLSAILLLAISCTKESTSRYSSTVAQSTENTLKFKIGQRYGGGIIFYIDSTGQHGLIADTVDLPPSKWWNGVNVVTGAKGTVIGTGEKNTRKIISAQGDSGIHYAALRCWNYEGSGYTDWYLPSKDELNELYKQKSVVGGFVNERYWSSSDYTTNLVWAQHFVGGNQFGSTKKSTFNVRAIRAF